VPALGCHHSFERGRVPLLLLQQLHRAGHHPAGELQKNRRALSRRHAAIRHASAAPTAASAAEEAGRGSHRAGSPAVEHLADRRKKPRPALITLLRPHRRTPGPGRHAGAHPAGVLGTGRTTGMWGKGLLRLPQGLTPAKNRESAAGLDPSAKDWARGQPGVICWGLTASSTPLCSGQRLDRCRQPPSAAPGARPGPLAHTRPGSPAATGALLKQRNQQRTGHAAATNSHPERPVHQDDHTWISPGRHPEIGSARQGLGRPPIGARSLELTMVGERLFAEAVVTVTHGWGQKTGKCFRRPVPGGHRGVGAASSLVYRRRCCLIGLHHVGLMITVLRSAGPESPAASHRSCGGFHRVTPRRPAKTRACRSPPPRGSSIEKSGSELKGAAAAALARRCLRGCCGWRCLSGVVVRVRRRSRHRIVRHSETTARRREETRHLESSFVLVCTQIGCPTPVGAKLSTHRQFRSEPAIGLGSAARSDRSDLALRSGRGRTARRAIFAASASASPPLSQSTCSVPPRASEFPGRAPGPASRNSCQALSGSKPIAQSSIIRTSPQRIDGPGVQAEPAELRARSKPVCGVIAATSTVAETSLGQALLAGDALQGARRRAGRLSYGRIRAEMNAAPPWPFG